MAILMKTIHSRRGISEPASTILEHDFEGPAPGRIANLVDDRVNCPLIRKFPTLSLNSSIGRRHYQEQRSCQCFEKVPPISISERCCLSCRQSKRSNQSSKPAIAGSRRTLYKTRSHRRSRQKVFAMQRLATSRFITDVDSKTCQDFSTALLHGFAEEFTTPVELR